MERLTSKSFWNSSYYIEEKRIKPLKKQWGGIVSRHLIKIFNKYLPKGRLKFLEMGCGDSKWPIFFAKYFGYIVSGVDYSDVGINLIKKRIEVENIQAKIIKADFFNLPSDFPTDFDIVASFGVIEHFENYVEVLKLFSDLMNENGILITGVPKLTGLQGYIQKKVDKKIYEKHVVITKEDLVKAYEILNIKKLIVMEVGLFSIGFNFKNRRFFRTLYKYYKGIINKVFKLVIPCSVVNRLRSGSYYIIIGRKNYK